ncbi:MAG TPA: M13 family metallopeptidase [Bryobacteraceae bacterium]|nr:M13 family metallopeptidase [Bryobacteraceae bacterium]
MRFFPCTILIIGCLAASAQDSKVNKDAGSKVTPVFDPSALDSTADPCVDFYQYACGTWLAKNPIPPDRPEWARFDELEERNLAILREILEKAAVNSPKRSPIEQKIGDYYAACMDEAAIEKKGIEPIKPELDRIAALSDNNLLADEVAHLQRAGANVLFLFTSQQDYKNANAMIALADQGGLGLPERDYYLKDDQKSVETRQKYLEHVTKMFQLLGDSPERAAARAQAVMSIESALATGSLDVVSRRDPARIYHKTRREELVLSLAPSFAWPKYLASINAPAIESLNVAVPEFFKALDSLVNTARLDDWKTYLTWQLVHAHAPLLSSGFVHENFDFYGKYLTGAQELRPRWKRCVQFVDNDLGEALGQKYVERTFGAEGKERTLQMVHTLESALGKDLMALDWMSLATKQKAIEKLNAITNKIGYPDKWRDYSSVKIVRGDAAGNDERATEFEFQRQLDKIGKPVDHTEWQMTPPTVNAYYDPQMNDINFPAGILQPPMFDKSADDAVNFGAIGSIIGHELTHGFDDEGRQFDAKGNLRDWWTAQDAAEFEKRASCLVDEYSSFKAVEGLKVNGKLTLGENTADFGGLRVAYMALMEDLAARTMPKVDGFTSEQRFFLAYAQSNCETESDELLRLSAQTDPHSPPKFRVNGIVQNMPEFQKAFGCRLGQPMVRKPACRVW